MAKVTQLVAEQGHNFLVRILPASSPIACAQVHVAMSTVTMVSISAVTLQLNASFKNNSVPLD